jgi:NADPH:quinone reductase-like Zn-dependent oxidoreductase
MSYPKTYDAWRRSTTPFPRSLVLSTETLPEKLEAKDVLIRVHAVSLNYRDVAMLKEGGYPLTVEDGGITGTDCAAEVIAIGNEVTKFVIGDHVAPTSDLLSLSGKEREMDEFSLGSNRPGTLRQFAIFEEEVLVKLPAHLTWEEVC